MDSLIFSTKSAMKKSYSLSHWQILECGSGVHAPLDLEEMALLGLLINNFPQNLDEIVALE